MELALAVEDLRIEADGVVLVDGVSLSISPGRILGLVGESGSGKTMTVMSIPRLLPPVCRITEGTIKFGDVDLVHADERTLRTLRGREIGVVFQDPFTSFNPVRRVGSLLEETLRRHSGLSASQAQDASVAALAEVGLADPSRKAQAYPHQLSGGQRQRALIALALINRPRLLIADEPTTALDATVQVEILDLLRSSVARTAGACIFVTHDLGAAAYLCDDIAVMYAGRIAELGPTQTVIASPRHPYTRELLNCVPRMSGVDPIKSMGGNPPLPIERSIGCAFAPRCAYATATCAQRPPLMGSPDHSVACHHPLVASAV